MERDPRENSGAGVAVAVILLLLICPCVGILGFLGLALVGVRSTAIPPPPPTVMTAPPIQQPPPVAPPQMIPESTIETPVEPIETKAEEVTPPPDRK